MDKIDRPNKKNGQYWYSEIPVQMMNEWGYPSADYFSFAGFVKTETLWNRNTDMYTASQILGIITGYNTQKE